MLMDSEYQIWEACTKDDMRPALTCVNFIRKEDVTECDIELVGADNGIAVATDGYMLVVVPVEFEDDDVPGLVPAEIVKQAAKESKKFKNIYNGRTHIQLGEDTVTIPFQVQMPRGIVDMGLYPDVWPIVPKEIPTVEPDNARSNLALDMSLLLRLGKALGKPPVRNKSANVVINFNGKKYEPYYVQLTNHEYKVAPFGLLMPIHYGS
ncbi:MAG: hypothetical protein ACXADB_11565 [Candidatus Hermodarchaeia archaeon]